MSLKVEFFDRREGERVGSAVFEEGRVDVEARNADLELRLRLFLMTPTVGFAAGPVVGASFVTTDEPGTLDHFVRRCQLVQQMGLEAREVHP